MVTVETRIQKEIHRLIVEETWKHLKTSNNFDMVLSLVTLLDPYTPEPDYCDEDCKIMCIGCYDGNYSIDWREFSNLINNKPFCYLTSHELDRFVDAINDKVHKCDKFCSEFINSRGHQVIKSHVPCKQHNLDKMGNKTCFRLNWLS